MTWRGAVKRKQCKKANGKENKIKEKKHLASGKGKKNTRAGGGDPVNLFIRFGCVCGRVIFFGSYIFIHNIHVYTFHSFFFPLWD